MGKDTKESQQWDRVKARMPEVEVGCRAAEVNPDCTSIAFASEDQPGIPDLAQDNQTTQRRDRLLETTAKATNVLLTLESLDEAINTALNIIGEGIGCDFICVLENVFESPSPLPTYCNFLYEWAAAGLVPLSVSFGSKHLPAELMGTALLEQHFLEGDGFGGLLEAWHEPMRSVFASIQIQSAYAVPIRVNGQWWGVLGLDYCRMAVQVNPPEVAVLRTIADCIGSAIQRDRLQQERQQAAQQRTADLEAYTQVLQSRDRLLETAAKAANVLLTVENFDEAINTALGLFLEGAGCDRISILENVFEASSPLPIQYKFIYEWANSNFIIRTTQPDIGCIPAEAIGKEFLERHFLKGDGFEGLLEEWDEPLRSSLAAAQVKSACSVPVRVNGQWWGVLCFDYCQEAIRVSPAEVAVLRTIADCIGSAIERDRTQKIILQAEQTRVAELVKANTALKQSLDTLGTDPDFDRFIGNTLKLIAHQFEAPLIEYWVHSEQVSKAHIYLIYWQGQILKTENGESPDCTSQDLIPFLDILLSVGDTNLGALAIYLPSPRVFSGQTIELAHALAQQLTLAVELTRLAEEAQQAALLQERTRMAREIHDTLAQAFGGILMQLQAVTYFATTQPEKARTHLLTAQALAQDGLAEARRSVWTLYLETAEYEDPSQMIAKFIEQTTPGQSAHISLAIEGTPYRLHPDVGLNLLRIAQESITNALRHAHAQTVQVHLNYSPQTVELKVCDDGCGFEPQLPSGGFGLLGMQQRAARIGANWHLVSHVGQGTTITVRIAQPMVP